MMRRNLKNITLQNTIVNIPTKETDNTFTEKRTSNIFIDSSSNFLREKETIKNEAINTSFNKTYVSPTLSKNESACFNSDVYSSSKFFQDNNDLDYFKRKNIPFISESNESNNDNSFFNKFNDGNFSSTTLKNESLRINTWKQMEFSSHSSSNFNSNKGDEMYKTSSSLEASLKLLDNNDAYVGLDYIIEYKKNVSNSTSFSFRCNLCNSSISKLTIVGHILGTKHRLRYLKIKDEKIYDYLMSLKISKEEKDKEVAAAALELERKYGRGHVTIEMENSSESITNENNIISNENQNQSNEAISETESIASHSSYQESFDGIHKSSVIHPMSYENSNSQDVKDIAANINLTDTNAPFFPKQIDFSSISLSNINMASVLSVIEKTKEAKIKSEKNQDYSINSLPSKEKEIENSLKRSASPTSDKVLSKIQKIEADNNDIHENMFTTSIKEENINPISSYCEVNKELFPIAMSKADILENLSKCHISTDEEAEFIMQVIKRLLELILNYRLKHIECNEQEFLFKSLDTNNSNEIEKLLSLLSKEKSQTLNLGKDDVLEDKNIAENANGTTMHVIEELKNRVTNLENINSISKIDLDSMKTGLLTEVISNQDKDLEPNNTKSSRSCNLSSDNLPFNEKISDSILSTPLSNTSQTSKENDNLISKDTIVNVKQLSSANVTNIEAVEKSPISISTLGSELLKPPPFFTNSMNNSWVNMNSTQGEKTSQLPDQNSNRSSWNMPYYSYTDIPGSYYPHLQAYSSYPQMYACTPPPLPNTHPTIPNINQTIPHSPYISNTAIVNTPAPYANNLNVPLPNVSLPQTPNTHVPLPNVSLPQAPSSHVPLPNVSIPQAPISHIPLPNISLPKAPSTHVPLPNISFHQAPNSHLLPNTPQVSASTPPEPPLPPTYPIALSDVPLPPPLPPDEGT